MNDEERKKILAETMEIIEGLFYVKLSGDDTLHEYEGDKGYYYVGPKTAKKLKQQLIKYRMR